MPTLPEAAEPSPPLPQIFKFVVASLVYSCSNLFVIFVSRKLLSILCMHILRVNLVLDLLSYLVFRVIDLVQNIGKILCMYIAAFVQ